MRSLGILHNLLMGLEVSDFVSVGHIYFSIKSLHFFVSDSYFSVSTSLGFTIRHPYHSMMNDARYHSSNPAFDSSSNPASDPNSNPGLNPISDPSLKFRYPLFFSSVYNCNRFGVLKL